MIPVDAYLLLVGLDLGVAVELARRVGEEARVLAITLIIVGLGKYIKIARSLKD